MIRVERSRISKPPLKPLSLTIFFPCYNEEANVERVTRAAVEIGRKVADELEVIIVNDGSRDRTGEIADRLHVVDVLGRLVDRSLVVAEQDGSGTRYRLLGVIRSREFCEAVEALGGYDTAEAGEVLYRQ